MNQELQHALVTLLHSTQQHLPLILEQYLMMAYVKSLIYSVTSLLFLLLSAFSLPKFWNHDDPNVAVVGGCLTFCVLVISLVVCFHNSVALITIKFTPQAWLLDHFTNSMCL